MKLPQISSLEELKLQKQQLRKNVWNWKNNWKVISVQ